MKQQRIIAAAIAIGSFLLVGLMYRLTDPPNSQRPVDGPSTDVLKSSGIFKPGGYVDFEFSPGIESIKGLYKGQVVTWASLGNAYKSEALWPHVLRDVGRDWGRSLPQGFARSFSVTHRVAIPNDESVAGKNVTFLMDFSLAYPVRVDVDSFRQEREGFEEYLTIELSSEPATPDELAWAQTWEPGMLVEILSVALFLVGCTALLYTIIPWKSR